MGNVVAVTRGVYSDGTLESVAAAAYKKCCGRGRLYILAGGNTGNTLCHCGILYLPVIPSSFGETFWVC